LISIESTTYAACIVSALLFIVALAGLSRHESAKLGNTFGIAGMTVALAATVALAIDRGISGLGLGLLAVAMLVGASTGLQRARRVEMTGMPELIAPLHSFVGLAAVLFGWNGYLHVGGRATVELDAEGMLGIHSAEVIIGAVTFTGSVVAYLKLSGKVKCSPLSLPGKNLLNLAALTAFAALTVWFVIEPQLWMLVVATVLALFLGWHLVASIGSGDMPVVVSMLNSYSGWAAATSGFLLANDLLIVTGALVGASGAYLSYTMCKAMNRRSSPSSRVDSVSLPHRATKPTTVTTARRTPTPLPNCCRMPNPSSSPPAMEWPSPRPSTASQTSPADSVKW